MMKLFAMLMTVMLAVPLGAVTVCAMPDVRHVEVKPKAEAPMPCHETEGRVSMHEQHDTRGQHEGHAGAQPCDAHAGACMVEVDHDTQSSTAKVEIPAAFTAVLDVLPVDTGVSLSDAVASARHYELTSSPPQVSIFILRI